MMVDKRGVFCVPAFSARRAARSHRRGRQLSPAASWATWRDAVIRVTLRYVAHGLRLGAGGFAVEKFGLDRLRHLKRRRDTCQGTPLCEIDAIQIVNSRISFRRAVGPAGDASPQEIFLRLTVAPWLGAIIGMNASCAVGPRVFAPPLCLPGDGLVTILSAKSPPFWRYGNHANRFEHCAGHRLPCAGAILAIGPWWG